MLDCVLLENRHDLTKMQEELGLIILKDHSKILLTEYTQSKGYAEKLLKGIGYSDTSSLISLLQSMPDIDGDRPRKYFQKAMEVGYMNFKGDGCEWVFGGKHGGKARLGYFLVKVYCPKNTDRFHASQIKQLESLFNVIRRDRVFDQNIATGKTRRVLQWRSEIDNLFSD